MTTQETYDDRPTKSNDGDYVRTVVIETGSQAWNELKELFADETARKVSLEIRRHGVAVKFNEYMWTPTLDIKA
jgi:hypothetical protein